MTDWFDSFDWHDFCRCKQGRNVYLFGAAQTALECVASKITEVKGVFDSVKYDRMFLNWKILNPIQLFNWDLERVVILITCQYYDEVSNLLRSLGVKYFFHYETIMSNIGESDISVDYLLALPKQKERPMAWYREHRCYAHALGTVDGIMYTNSQEAFEQSYSRGFRVFEVDLCFTEKNELILCHDVTCIWKENGDYPKIEIGKNIYNTLNSLGVPQSFKTYAQEKVYGKYTALSLDDWVEIMKNNRDIFCVTHVRGNRRIEQYKLLVDLCNRIDRALLERFIIQIENEQEKKMVTNLYPFQNINLFAVDKPIKSIVLKAIYSDIDMIVMDKNRITNDIISLCERTGLKICVYNLNEVKTATRLLKNGISVCCMESNYIK